MDEWTAAVCADLGLDASDADFRAVLDLTRDVAHGVARPAAPLTAYLVGVAVGRGLTNAEIARTLHLSVPTVKAHVSRLFEKLAVTNRVQIAIVVHDAGLV